MKKNNIKNYTLDASAQNGIRYVGQYYVTDIPDKQRRKGGICQLAAGLAELLLIMLAISVNGIGCHTVYIIIPLELILFCSLYYLIGSYTYMRSSDRMEQKVYDKAYSNPVQIVTVAIVLNLISLAGQTILVIRNVQEFTDNRDYVFLAIILVLFMLHIWMWKHQKSLFERVKAEEKGMH